MITITSKDALRSKTLKPGQYEGKVTSYVAKTAGTDGSLLHVWGIEVNDNGHWTPIKDYQVSEKAVSMGKDFFIACGFPREEWEKLEREEVGAQQLDPNDCVGVGIRVSVKNSIFNDKVSNEANGFLPLNK